MALEEGESPRRRPPSGWRGGRGPGVSVKGPVEGRYNVVAAARGLLRFDTAALQALNELDDVSIFALYDGQTVEPGEVWPG